MLQPSKNTPTIFLLNFVYPTIYCGVHFLGVHALQVVSMHQQYFNIAWETVVGRVPCGLDVEILFVFKKYDIY